MFGEVNEKQAEYLKDIHSSGRHLLSLINDILDLSKIEAGRMELELSSFDLPSALDNALTLVRERAQRHWHHSSASRSIEQLGEFTRRRAQVQADHAEPAVQRGEVHARRRAGSTSRREACNGVVEVAVTRHRRRHRARGSGGGVRGVPAGRARPDEEGRGHGPGPRAHQALRRAARRRDPAGERAGQGLDVYRSLPLFFRSLKSKSPVKSRSWCSPACDGLGEAVLDQLIEQVLRLAR